MFVEEIFSLQSEKISEDFKNDSMNMIYFEKLVELENRQSNTENSAQKTESAIDWEAIFSVAFIVAYHTFGVLGTPLKTFLSNLLFELCDWKCPEPPEIPDQMELKFLEELLISFLSPIE